MSYIRVKGHDHLIRDPKTNSIINTNMSEYKEYLSKRDSKIEDKNNLEYFNIFKSRLRDVHKNFGTISIAVKNDFFVLFINKPTAEAIDQMFEISVEFNNLILPIQSLSNYNEINYEEINEYYNKPAYLRTIMSTKIHDLNTKHINIRKCIPFIIHWFNFKITKKKTKLFEPRLIINIFDYI